ncbi:hypothetical protein M7I_8155 [Glarea lozoyensis 74030]|uniref:C3H1-type domain-containing protein n=1 Tax=Glarea lozoyensis (strain ATCC 74030 / MF5533) TaxID=1104152 RepID=H0EZ92_GLAL7|nr:hypothetical protein M7I_8155 [Glarea lozoyensis 74030]
MSGQGRGRGNIPNRPQANRGAHRNQPYNSYPHMNQHMAQNNNQNPQSPQMTSPFYHQLPPNLPYVNTPPQQAQMGANPQSAPPPAYTPHPSMAPHPSMGVIGPAPMIPQIYNIDQALQIQTVDSMPEHFAPNFYRFLHRDRTLRQSQIVPGIARISYPQRYAAYGYALHRGGGRYTRLIPADQLPPGIMGSVQTWQSPEGLIILPHTFQPNPEQRRASGRDDELSENLVNAVYYENFRDIDVYGRNHAGEYQPTPNGNIQGFIDSVTNAAGSSMGKPPAPAAQESKKTFCSKYLHQGICAFSHEMPMDKAGLRAIGLNDIPEWWYRRQEEDREERMRAQSLIAQNTSEANAKSSVPGMINHPATSTTPMKDFSEAVDKQEAAEAAEATNNHGRMSGSWRQGRASMSGGHHGYAQNHGPAQEGGREMHSHQTQVRRRTIGGRSAGSPEPRPKKGSGPDGEKWERGRRPSPRPRN